ncbi:Glucan endo-1,3-alpha-glucosidase agn1 [Ciborinia camelliae]|nr:Glucan endo-1,3-alpha-glucosidase agn1 [Ciborinia camelliae]
MKILQIFSWLLAISLQYQAVVALPGYTDLRHFQRAAAADQITCSTYEKAVFAHFMVGNVYKWTDVEWIRDMTVAKAAGIDAFVLNMGSLDKNLDVSIAYAFSAATEIAFKVLFSFDYALGWDKADVLSYINEYKGKPCYYIYKGKPLVSTFEGAGSSDDWKDIKAQTGITFIPDWSSLGAKNALALGVADGLFSWAAWPWGDLDMNTYVDASYADFLNGMPYMMPVSPWFYTNLPEYNKNWLWRGDDLWYDRWEEIMFWQPDLVEIISWNDYGESHYVGPIDTTTMDAMESAPINYALGMDHDAWLLFLPFIIGMYKFGTSPVYQEGVQAWYRLNPNSAHCSTNGTVGNTASQLLLEFLPDLVSQDKIFFSALLSSEADVFVTINGQDAGASWLKKPFGGTGIYHGSVDIFTLGPVSITIQRGSTVIASVTGKTITADCQDGLTNYNAFVMGELGDVSSAVPIIPLCSLNCTSGSGAGDFEKLCEFSCAIGYCPKGACYCTGMGEAVLPKVSGPIGYPIAGADANYEGLCAFACVYGYCPPAHCGTVSGLPMATPTVSPFTPPACTEGSGVGLLEGLCSFACNFGYCPMAACTCTVSGPLNASPPTQPNIIAGAADGLDPNTFGILCIFACQHGWCPSDVCKTTSTGSGPVYIDPSIFTAEPPQINAELPCTLVFPPSTYPGETVFSFPPVMTTLRLGSGDNIVQITTTITPQPSTGSVVSFFNMPLDPSLSGGFLFAMTSSFNPPPLVVTVNFISTVYTTQLWFDPVTMPSNWQLGGEAAQSTTTQAGAILFPPVEWPALPTTTYCSNAICQTYSMDQITTLTSAPSPTTAIISVPIPPTTKGQTTSPIIIVTVPVQSSGYYWSPVPFPTPPALPWPTIPGLPGLPPLPSFPCIHLGFFKVDCPPNKNPPTTRFNTGPPAPTCKANCGTICIENCAITGDATSETESESECTTSTVTDIFVSCSTGSCTTTRTSLVSGCSVLATSTTTEAPYCPSGVPGPQDDDTDSNETPLVMGIVHNGEPQNGIAIMGTERYAIYYAPLTDQPGWYWHYKSQEIGLPTAMLQPGTVTAAVYPSDEMPFPTVIIIPPTDQATRLEPTGNNFEMEEFNTIRDCDLCEGTDCLTRTSGKDNPPCCAEGWCPPAYAMCNCDSGGACAGTDPECCFDGAGINC